MATCPNCGAELKKSVFGSNLPLTSEAINFINTFTDNDKHHYCEKCGKDLVLTAQLQAVNKNNLLRTKLNKYIHYVPLLSLQAPAEWNFTPLGLVTGQSVTGTGVFSEFASSWTDFFGAQSNAYNKKIAGGETICQTQLRLKCIEMGGNAILAVDIDYAEVGGGKGMLMVCMTGTAVLLENTDVMGAEKLEGLNILTETAKNQRAMRRFANIIANHSHTITTEVGV